MIEIERKFLVSSNAFKEEAHVAKRICQGYLSTDPSRTVRVRIKENQAFLTIKGQANSLGMTRTEIEEEISIPKAEKLLELCLPGVIDKVRYEVSVGNHLWEIDEFHETNSGLILAEIELQSEDEIFQRPLWLGKEVTGNKDYYNSQLSIKPFTTWKNS